MTEKAGEQGSVTFPVPIREAIESRDKDLRENLHHILLASVMLTLFNRGNKPRDWTGKSTADAIEWIGKGKLSFEQGFHILGQVLLGRDATVQELDQALHAALAEAGLDVGEAP